MCVVAKVPGLGHGNDRRSLALSYSMINTTVIGALGLPLPATVIVGMWCELCVCSVHDRRHVLQQFDRLCESVCDVCGGARHTQSTGAGIHHRRAGWCPHAIARPAGTVFVCVTHR